MGQKQTITRIAILPELDRGNGIAVYQIVALCGTAEEPTETMKQHMYLFGRTFQKIEDRVFPHNPVSAMFHDWSKDASRPTPESYPQIIKTTSPANYEMVSERLREQYKVSELELLEGDLAIIELRKNVALLSSQRDLFAMSPETPLVYFRE
jgi:hypothetical protein